ncbi:MAG: hypothetical protein M9887_00905 [Chitinophagales bacterium]|nr:hypothetical protein [Chitinophagales bacterium]
MTVMPDYTHLLDHPHLIAEMDKEVFHNWVNAYPYVPIYRVLLAVKYQTENSDEVEKYIREAAFYVQDRKRFKKLLRFWQEKITTESEKTDTIIAVEKEEENDLKETVEVAEVSQSIEIEKLESISKVNETGATVKEESIEATFTQGKEEVELSIPETIESETNSSVGDGVINTQKVEIVNTDIDWLLPWIEDFDVDFSASTSNQEAKKVEVASETVARQVPNEVIQEKEKLEDKGGQISTEKIYTVKNQEEKGVSTDGSHSFDEWLNILEQKKRGDEDAPIFDLPVPNILKDEEKIVAEKGNSTEKPETIEIDEQTVKKIANESISFKDDMVTETLAKLYEIQGKKEQAIYIYQQLMEKYPKKSTYFASKIKKIK